jgi:hypothetical protein
MGQVPDDLNVEIEAVEAEVKALRDRTQHVVAELERRLRARAARARQTIARVRHVADVRARLQEHPRVVLGVTTVAAVALGVGVCVTVSRLRARQQPLNRLRARARAYRALLSEPRRALRRHDPLGQRLLAAALIAGATTLVRGLGMLLVKRTIAPRMLPAPEHEEPVT